MKTIILINGPKRGGKDFSANLLIEKLNEKIRTRILSFAYPLKKIIADTFGITSEELDKFKNDKEPLYREIPKLDGYDYEKVTDYREILQNFGTEGMKPQFGVSVWADLLLSKILDSDEPEIILVPDFRFNIESAVIKSSNYRVITLKIRNDDIDTTDGHASERELDDYVFDAVVDNTGHSPYLSKRLDEFIVEYDLN